MSTEQLLTELKDGNPSEVPQEGHHRSLWSLQARGDVEEKGLGQTVNLLVLLLQEGTCRALGMAASHRD